MKQNFTKQCGFMLLLMLFTILQTAFADKQTPTVSFTPNTNDYTVTAGAAYFSRPSVTVEDSKGTPIRSKFKLIWTVENSDGSPPPNPLTRTASVSTRTPLPAHRYRSYMAK